MDQKDKEDKFADFFEQIGKNYFTWWKFIIVLSGFFLSLVTWLILIARGNEENTALGWTAGIFVAFIAFIYLVVAEKTIRKVVGWLIVGGLTLIALSIAALIFGFFYSLSASIGDWGGVDASGAIFGIILGGILAGIFLFNAIFPILIIGSIFLAPEPEKREKKQTFIYNYKAIKREGGKSEKGKIRATDKKKATEILKELGFIEIIGISEMSALKEQSPELIKTMRRIYLNKTP